MRDKIVNSQIRIDGRKFDQIREIAARPDICHEPMVHPCLPAARPRPWFQQLSAVNGIKQRVETLHGEVTNRFMLHYNFPPYCVGEVRGLRGPSRRDIGHGNLATRGLEAVLPSEEDFPYSIRVVSEVLESNGSSSMATVCGGSMAMMDAGVPLKSPVSGIAMGLD